MISGILKNYKAFLLSLVIGVSFWGILSLTGIPKEAFPSITLPIYTVVTVYPGADPTSVEEIITRKFEQQFKSINGLKKISSRSNANSSVITLEFFKEKNDNDAFNDIKTVVDRLYSTFPTDVQYPQVRKIDISDQPMYIFSVGGPYSPTTMYQKLQSLEDKIKSTQGVSEVKVLGKPLEQIQIRFQYNQLLRYDLDYATVINTIRGSLLKLGVDKKSVNNNLYTFEITTYDRSLTGLLDTIRDLDLVVSGGRPLKLGDVAKIFLAPKQDANESYIVYTGDQAYNALTFQVKKVPGADIEDITLSVKKVVDDFKVLNSELFYYEIVTQEENITRTYNTFIGNFLGTGVVVYAILYLVLGGSISLIVVMAFFVAYFMTFAYLQSIGYTFNNVVSFSLILVLGIMVDNLIVIAEGIIESYKKGAKNVYEAVEYSISTYFTPLMSGTLTTIVLFLPLGIFVTGTLGEFIKFLPVTVNATLIFSLVSALLVVPLLVVYISKNKTEHQKNKVLERLEHQGERFAQWYYDHTKSTRGKWKFILGTWVIFLSGFVMLGTGLVKVDFFSASDGNNLWINIKYAPGVSLEQNRTYTNAVWKEVYEFMTPYHQDIKYTTIDLGSQAQGGDNGSNVANIAFRLTPTQDREIKSFELVEILNTFMGDLKKRYPNLVDISALTARNGPGQGKPVGFFVVGEDLIQMSDYIQKILPQIAQIPEIFNLSVSVDYTNGKIQYLLDDTKIKELKVNPGSVSSILSSLRNSSYQPNGIKIKEFNEFGSDEALEMKAFIDYTGDIDTIKIGNIYLDQLVKKTTLLPELKTITKEDGNKVIKIEADKLSDVPLSVVTAKIDEILKNNPFPEGLKYKPGADIQDQQNSGRDLGLAMMVGLILMILVLIFEFNSFSYPFIILHSVLLTFGGSILALFLAGQPFGFVAQLGIFGVMGVGVNDSIVLLEKMRDLMKLKPDIDLHEGFKIAIAERFTPILMTTATTVIGLATLATDEFFGGLAFTFMGGIIMAIFISLLYVPAVVMLASKPGLISWCKEKIKTIYHHFRK